MKKQIHWVLTLIFTLVTIGLSAQIVEQKNEMSLGDKTAVVVDLAGVSDKEAADLWKEFFKDYGKVKKNNKAKEWVSEQDVIEKLNGKDPVSTYAKFEELEDMTRMYLWVDLGDGFMNSEAYPDQSKAMNGMLEHFLVHTEKYVVSEDLKDQEKTLKTLGKDLKGLVKDQEKYEKEIEKAKETIAKMEKNIEESIAAQETKATEITAQEGVIEEVKEKLNSVGKAMKQKSKM